MWQFHIGQQVACLAKEFYLEIKGIMPSVGPLANNVYTVVELKMLSELLASEYPGYCCNRDELYLRVAEDSGWFPASAFRPVRKTDISELEKLLMPLDVKKQIADIVTVE